LISNLVSRIREEVASQLAPLPSAHLVLAVSGGPDSLCLADAVLAIAPRRMLRPIIAHLDHGLRGEAAAADADFVRAFAEARGVPCVVERADVRVYAREQKCSIEVAARTLRYRFLSRVAEAYQAPWVALAHHADDQAETVLLRLIRGTGLAGLRGMQIRSPLPTAPHLTAVRPLLRVLRADIEQYCHEQRLNPRHDATNDALDYMRNRIRHELLPLLERYNPNIRAALVRLADTVAADLDIIAQATQSAFARLAQPKDDGFVFDRRAWRALSVGLQRATLRWAAQQLRGEAVELPYAAVEEARDVLNSDAPSGDIALARDVRIKVDKDFFIVRKLHSYNSSDG
jgi:tRNA(Ile)-lysidine synthetase-like protein